MEITIRSLTRKEVKKLKKNGGPLMTSDPGKMEEVLDAVFALVLSKQQAEALENRGYKESLDIFNQILIATFGDPAAEKN